MAQAGIHGLVGMAVRRWMPKKEWLMLGIILGSMLPDMDNLAVAYATLTGLDTHGLHRTFSHSLIVILGLVFVFYLIARITKRSRLNNLGFGIGIGMTLHSLLDLILWFRGVELFWPFFGEINLWSGYTPPAWWYNTLESALEFLFIAVFFGLLLYLAKKQGTDKGFLKKLQVWTWLQFGLFSVFLVLVYTWDGFFIVHGALYLLSMILAFGITIRMRDTIEYR